MMQSGESKAVPSHSGENAFPASELKYDHLQIAASEALRAGGNLDLSREDRLTYFKQSAFYSAKAFVAARENVFHRLLALDQYKSAQAMLLLVESNYNARVIEVQDPDPATLKGIESLAHVSVQEALDAGL